MKRPLQQIQQHILIEYMQSKPDVSSERIRDLKVRT